MVASAGVECYTTLYQRCIIYFTALSSSWYTVSPGFLAPAVVSTSEFGIIRQTAASIDPLGKIPLMEFLGDVLSPMGPTMLADNPDGRARACRDCLLAQAAFSAAGRSGAAAKGALSPP